MSIVTKIYTIRDAYFVRPRRILIILMIPVSTSASNGISIFDVTSTILVGCVRCQAIKPTQGMRVATTVTNKNFVRLKGDHLLDLDKFIVDIKPPASFLGCASLEKSRS